MEESLTAMLLNPVRMRIVQFLMSHPASTAAQIGAALPDVSQASLYRHLNKLLRAGALRVAAERRVRGTVEKTYALNDHFQQEKFEELPGNEFLRKQSAAYLLSIMGEFERYFSNPQADPFADTVSLRSAALFLSEDEMRELLTEIGQALNKRLENPPGDGRRLRRVGVTTLPLDCAPTREKPSDPLE